MIYSGAPRHSMQPGRGREFPGEHDQKVHAGFAGARLAGEGALKDAFAGKPGAYRSGFFSARNFDTKSVSWTLLFKYVSQLL
jgi:hypothetical protein